MHYQLSKKQQGYMVFVGRLKKYKCRIGKKPYFYFINDKEALDIDNLDDLKLANFYSQ